MAMVAEEEIRRTNENLTARLVRGLFGPTVEDEMSKEFKLYWHIETLKREYREYGG